MIELVAALRLAVLVGWSIIALWALPSLGRALDARDRDGDWPQVALAIVGVSLVGFQVNVLSGSVPPRSDYWSAVFLLGLALGAAVVIYLVHLPRTPAAHKRALVWSNLGILALCLLGGFVA